MKNLETELDAQVSRIAKQEREKAKLETEFEKRELEEKLQTELDEMKAQLKLFQKVNCILKEVTSFLIFIQNIYLLTSFTMYFF